MDCLCLEGSLCRNIRTCTCLRIRCHRPLEMEEMEALFSVVLELVGIVGDRKYIDYLQRDSLI